jgi:restriction system protein
MAEITRKRTGELVRKLFEILMKHAEGLQAAEALKRLAASVTLTDYEAGTYESGVRRFDQIVRFATVDCAKAGWLLKQKGTWSVSDAGARAFQTYPNPRHSIAKRAACTKYGRLLKSGRASRNRTT